MKKSVFWIFFFLVLISLLPGEPKKSTLWGNLLPGPHPVGFQLLTTTDYSRIFHSNPGYRGLPAAGETARQVRIYLWYPGKAAARESLRYDAFVRMAAEDFDLLEPEPAPGDKPLPLPVPLRKGLTEEKRRQLLQQPTASVSELEPLAGPFPLIVIGQGLYYESPLSQLVLAEFLASHGYVVATCPLLGTYCRLVNLSMVDLETQVRDLEFVISQARALPCVDDKHLALVGYDLGGMATLLLSMRNPEVAAFLSLDCGILTPHPSGLPQISPHYREERFTVPWMHVTQSRFFSAQGSGEPTLWERKSFADSYLLLFDTTNHGDFTAYAMCGMENPVPGYWGPPQKDSGRLHETLCRYGLNFFDAYVKNDPQALASLNPESKEKGTGEILALLQRKTGKPAPLMADDLYDDIIRHGAAAAGARIREQGISDRNLGGLDEKTFNWLGYHFLYWWGRENEALDVFRLVCELFPRSANACDSLGEAYMVTGDKKKAAECYHQVLQLDPQNANAREMLRHLGEK